jgi:DNA-directed RNA polymerase specialized sigma24 family protein
MKAEFLKVYDRNVDAIFRYCFRKTGDRTLAKNITDETFKRVWDYRTAGDSIANMESSLRSIASRLLRQQAAKKLTSLSFIKFS